MSEILLGQGRRRPLSIRNWVAPLARHAGRLVLSLLCFLALWQVLVLVTDPPSYIFPRPLGVARALWSGLLGGTYLAALWATVSAVLAGFVLGSGVGVVLAVLLVSAPWLDRQLFPYIVGLQSMPKIAIAPLMVVWFGFGFESKILIIALICSFPVLINTMAGLQAVDKTHLELIRALCGSPMQAMRHVRLPHALPYIFSGLSSALVLAVTGAIVGEFVGSRRGIGVLILKANFNLDITSVFALLILLGCTSALLNVALKYIARRALFWT